MIKSVLFGLFIVLAVLGLCEIFYFFKMLFYYPGFKCDKCVIVVLRQKYALRQLNYIWQKIKWQGDDFANVVIGIIDYIDSEELTSCNDYSYQKNIILCDLNSLACCKCLQGDYLNGNR